MRWSLRYSNPKPSVTLSPFVTFVSPCIRVTYALSSARFRVTNDLEMESHLNALDTDFVDDRDAF